jgi:hypothetical protein
MQIWSKTCDSITAIKQLHRGRLCEHEYGEVLDALRGKGETKLPLGMKWEKAPSELRALVDRIGASWRRQKPGPREPHGEGALLHLGLTERGSGLGPPSVKRGAGSKGDLARLVVTAVGLPDGSRKPVRATLISPRVARVFGDPTMMLRPPQEAAERQQGVGKFDDPGLGDRFSRLLLAYRMYHGYMLSHTSNKISSVSLFAVIKKIVEMKPEETRKEQWAEKMVQGLRARYSRRQCRGSEPRRSSPSSSQQQRGQRPPHSSTGPVGSGGPGCTSSLAHRLGSGIAATLHFGSEPRKRGKSSWSKPSSGAPASSRSSTSAGPVPGALLRLVMDERFNNHFFVPPAKVQLSSPESMGSLDLSPSAMMGGSAAMWKSDCPDFYYTLLGEPWMRDYHVLWDLKVADLDQFLEMMGEKKTGWPSTEWLAVDVFLMGASWAVWGAETTLEDAVDRSCQILRLSSRVAYGSPAPSVGPKEPPAWFSHIDDLGGWVWGKDLDSALTAAREVVAEVKSGLGSLGIALHKIEVGERLVLCGVENGRFEDGSLLSGPERAGLRCNREATLALLELDARRGYVCPADVESIVGHWTYRMGSARAGFAIWDHIYAWIRKNRRRKRARLWPSLRGELRAACALCALFYADLGADWAEEVPVLDAAGFGSSGEPGGFGVVTIRPGLEATKEAARWAEQKGWFFQVHGSVPVEEQTGTHGGLFPEKATPGPMDELLQSEEQGRRVVYLGPAGSPLMDALKAAGERNIIECLPGRSLQGFSLPQLLRFREDALDPRTWAVVVDLSWAGFCPKRGKRSQLYPDGRPGVRPQTTRTLKEEEERISLIVEVIASFNARGLPAFWMHPEDSLAWNLQKVRDLLLQTEKGGESVSCVGWSAREGEALKRRVLTTASWFRTEVARRTEGPNSVAAADTIRDWASALLRRKPSSHEDRPAPGGEGTGDEPSHHRGPPPLKKRQGPPLPAIWGDPARYRLAVMGKWRHPEHCNVLEARTGILAMRRAARNRANHGKRQLLVTDSMASLGAFSRGRSSARSFVALCRRVSALKFATHSTYLWRYVETWRNCADGPSRGQRWPGVFGSPPDPSFSTSTGRSR